jgi:hypothetical protein
MGSLTSAVVCAHCGIVGPAGSTATDPPVDWMSESDERRGVVWLCPACVRSNVRSIEPRLDEQWW